MTGEGQYGKRLERATEYVINCQKANGLVTLVGPDGPEIARNVAHDIGETAAYNHAISSLMLSEVYGSSKGDRSARLKKSNGRSMRPGSGCCKVVPSPGGARPSDGGAASLLTAHSGAGIADSFIECVVLRRHAEKLLDFVF